MTPKEYLKQAYRLDHRINSDLEELEKLRELSTAISAVSFEERVSGTRPTDPPFVRYIDKIIDMENRINSEIDTFVDLKEQMRTAIDAIPNVDERMVLRYRYVQGMTWEDIAKELIADRSTVIRWHSKALKHFVIPQNCIVI